MKHRKEIVIGLSIILIVIELLTVTLPLFDNNSDSNDPLNVGNNTLRIEAEERNQTNLVKDEEIRWTFGASHFIGMTLCIICNIFVILGIKLKMPLLMLPWLVIYIINI